MDIGLLMLNISGIIPAPTLDLSTIPKSSQFSAFLTDCLLNELNGNDKVMNLNLKSRHSGSARC